MTTKLLFEYYTGKNLLVIKTSNKVYRIVRTGMKIKISVVPYGGLTPVKVRSL